MGRKVKTSVALDEDILRWIDEMIERKMFASRSHAIEYALENIRREREKTSEQEILKILLNNINLVESGLRIIQQDYKIDDARFDILAEDKNGNLVVIEVKKTANKDALIQLLYYMSLLHKANPTKGIRGIIIAQYLEEDATSILKFTKNIEIKTTRELNIMTI